MDVFNPLAVEPIRWLGAQKRRCSLLSPLPWPCRLLLLRPWGRSANVEAGSYRRVLLLLDLTSHWTFSGTIWLCLVDLARNLNTGSAKIPRLDTNTFIRVLAAANPSLRRKWAGVRISLLLGSGTYGAIGRTSKTAAMSASFAVISSWLNPMLLMVRRNRNLACLTVACDAYDSTACRFLSNACCSFLRTQQAPNKFVMLSQ